MSATISWKLLVYILRPGPISQLRNLDWLGWLTGFPNLVCLKLNYFCAVCWPPPLPGLFVSVKEMVLPSLPAPPGSSCQVLGNNLNSSLTLQQGTIAHLLLSLLTLWECIFLLDDDLTLLCSGPSAQFWNPSGSFLLGSLRFQVLWALKSHCRTDTENHRQDQCHQI